MNRITISLPDYVAVRLKEEVPAGQISQFVTEALQEKLVASQYQRGSASVKDEDPITRFVAAAENYPGVTRQKVLRAVQKGRK